jgi:hypothetical protein
MFEDSSPRSMNRGFPAYRCSEIGVKQRCRMPLFPTLKPFKLSILRPSCFLMKLQPIKQKGMAKRLIPETNPPFPFKAFQPISRQATPLPFHAVLLFMRGKTGIEFPFPAYNDVSKLL